MNELSQLTRQLVDAPPLPPTPRGELERRWRHRRRRRGYWAAAAAGLVAVVSVAVGAAGSGGGGEHVRVDAPPTVSSESVAPTSLPSGGPLSTTAPPTGPPTVPTEPAALAVGPNGDLYVADRSRNQILQRLPDGVFTVVAGTGTAGFSGDGGPAQRATLHGPSGMALATNGTLYFADQGSRRVRSISPGGVIETVAGGGGVGQSGFVSVGTPALQASINPADVTVGPGGGLYIATYEQVLRLETDGTLTPVVGSPDAPEGLYGVGGPATAGSADGANGIAFDAAGDLFVAGFNQKALLMVTPTGLLTQPAGSTPFYPRGYAGLASNANGPVVAMDGLTIVAVTPKGIKTLVNFMDAPLNSVNAFQPNGIAVGPDGTIYVDTSAGNGFTNRSAIVSVNPETLMSTILWQGPINGSG